MARIYDNIETKFAEGLQGIITNVGVKRVDFCVGYFNLRGWNLVVEQIDTLTGDYVYENDKRIFRKCRLLIGMHRPAEELIRQLYTEQVLPDANYVTMSVSANWRLPATSSVNSSWACPLSKTSLPFVASRHR